MHIHESNVEVKISTHKHTDMYTNASSFPLIIKGIIAINILGTRNAFDVYKHIRTHCPLCIVLCTLNTVYGKASSVPTRAHKFVLFGEKLW